MKHLYNYFFFLILLSCSSDDVAKEEVITPFTPKFEMLVNGVVYENQFLYATRSSNTISIGGLSFDENGNFGQMIYYHNEVNGTRKKFQSFRNFSSKYFDLHVNYDNLKKRVIGSFSGTLYYDPENLNSEGKFVSGSFDLPVVDYVSPVNGIGNQMKINDQEWRATNKYSIRLASNYYDVTIHSLSNDAYKIMIKFNDATTLPGIYNFTTTDAFNKVQLLKFDPVSGIYKTYLCTGILTITDRWANIIKGNYNFTAVSTTDPTDIIHVQSGNFKLDY